MVAFGRAVGQEGAFYDGLLPYLCVMRSDVCEIEYVARELVELLLRNAFPAQRTAMLGTLAALFFGKAYSGIRNNEEEPIRIFVANMRRLYAENTDALAAAVGAGTAL